MTADATQWYLAQLKPLIGGTIVGLAGAGDDFYGLDIRTKASTRKALFLLSDDEAKAPGSFETVSDE